MHNFIILYFWDLYFFKKNTFYHVTIDLVKRNNAT